MNDSIKKLRDGILRTKPQDLIYPGITLVFIIIVGVLFFTSARFISKNINDAFSDSTGGNESSLNMANYTLVTEKLGINIEPQNILNKDVVELEKIPETATTSSKILYKK